LTKGSHLRFEFRYDNSANNKYNPDPSRWVYQGFQSWEEMMAPNLGFVLNRDAMSAVSCPSQIEAAKLNK